MRLTSKWKESIEALSKQGLSKVLSTEFKSLNSTNLTSREEKSFKQLHTIGTSRSKRLIKPIITNADAIDSSQTPRIYLKKQLLNVEPKEESLPLLLTEASPEQKTHGVLRKSVLRNKEARNNELGHYGTRTPNEAMTFWNTNANSVIINTEINGSSSSTNQVKKSIKFIESPIKDKKINETYKTKAKLRNDESLSKSDSQSQSCSVSESDTDNSCLDERFNIPNRNTPPKKTITSMQSNTIPNINIKVDKSLNTIIKTKRNSITHQDDQKFFDILLKANTPMKPSNDHHPKSKPNIQSRDLNNQLLHLKVSMPKVIKEQLPLFTNTTNLNNYLLREFTTGDSKEQVKKREKVAHDAHIAIFKIEAEEKKQERKNHDYDRQLTKKISRKLSRRATKKFLDELSTKIYEEELKGEMNTTEGESKGMRMSKAIVKLNEMQYEDMSKQPPETISLRNLQHVQQLIKINKGTMDMVDYAAFGFSSGKKIKEEIGNNNYNAIIALSKLGPVSYVKKSFKPITIAKFSSANGHYF